MILTLSDIRNPIREVLAKYDNLFVQYLKSDSIVFGVMDYILSKRGKEIRPLLLLLCANLCKGISEKSLHGAVAMELLHTATLIHDDVVDEAKFRRGNETIHYRWNNKKAILVGDYLLTIVMQIFAKLRSHLLYATVSNLSKNLALGELVQLHHQQNTFQTEEDYLNIIKNKTAIFFATCAQIGAITSGATERQVNDLYHFGMNLGMCFQMKDDVLDYSDEDETGKQTLNDVKTGKITLPLLVSLQRASKEEREEIEMLLQNAIYTPFENSSTSDFEQVIRSFILRYGGIHYTYQCILKFKNKAMDSIANFHDSIAKDNLVNLLNFVVNRNY